MVQIKKAFPEDFDKIFPLTQEFINPDLTRSDWKQLFEIRWRSKENHVGFYLEEDGKAVGFLGTIFSQRIIDGIDRNFCNLSTWIVLEPYRGSSLMLLFEVMKMKEYTITNLTANRVASILRKVGFQDIAHQIIVIPPVPYPTALSSSATLVKDDQIDLNGLDAHAKQVFQDHYGLKCHHVLIRSQSEQCYLIYDVVKKKRIPAARVHYISNPKWFAENASWAALKFSLRTKTFGLLVAENLLSGRQVRGSFTIPQKNAMIFHSNKLTNLQMDTLYSELQVLGIRH